MSDTITKWHEMEEERLLAEKETNKTNGPMYIFVLDFLDGKVYRYDISQLCTEQNKFGDWAVTSEECEAFLIGAGHSLGNIEWMLTDKSEIEYGN